MAKKNLYAVIDTATGIYDGPIPGHSDAQMSRSFSDMAVNADHPIGQHPGHYALVKVGIWNDGTGELEDLQVMTVITGLEAVAHSRSEEKVKDNVQSLSAGGMA